MTLSFYATFGDHGGRFVEAFFIEVVVSVHDSGRWVADLDVLSTMEASQLYSLVQQPTYKEASPAGSIPEVEVISLDNWRSFSVRLGAPVLCTRMATGRQGLWPQMSV